MSRIGTDFLIIKRSVLIRAIRVHPLPNLLAGLMRSFVRLVDINCLFQDAFPQPGVQRVWGDQIHPVARGFFQVESLGVGPPLPTGQLFQVQ